MNRIRNFLRKLFDWEYGGYEEIKCECGQIYKIYKRIPTLAGIENINFHTREMVRHFSHG